MGGCIPPLAPWGHEPPPRDRLGGSEGHSAQALLAERGGWHVGCHPASPLMLLLPAARVLSQEHVRVEPLVAGALQPGEHTT